jgi:hypothetical protein
MIRRDDLDLHALLVGPEVLHGHAGGHHRALPREVRVEAGLIVEHADLDHSVGPLRERGDRPEGQHRRQHDGNTLHHDADSFVVVKDVGKPP